MSRPGRRPARLGPDCRSVRSRPVRRGPRRRDPMCANAPAHRLEELLLTRVANENPAVGPLRELIDDKALVEGTRYRDAIDRLETTFADGPPVPSWTAARSLLELMRLPARRAPTSLAGQLRYIRANWGPLLGADLDDLMRRLDLAIGVLAEEERALHLRFGGGGRRPRARADETPSFAGAGARAGGVLVRLGLDAARRPHGQEHVRLARPAVAGPRPRHPDARRDPRRGARHARPLGRHRPLADRAVGALQGVRADQAAARQPGRGRVRLFARRLPDRRRPRRRGRLREPARPRLGPRDPPGERHGPQPHGHRFALGDRAPGVVPVAPRAALPGLHLHGPGPLAGSARRDRPRGPLLGRHRRRGRLQALRPRDRRRSATSTTATTARASRGTTPPSSTSSTRPSASRSSGRSSTSPAASRSSGSMPPWSCAKKHIQRLWWPEPGSGGGIPSRAEHAISKAEFDRRMPREFWREVVDRVAAEVPGHAPAGRGVLAARGLLRPDARDAPRLQQRLHAHAPRRGQRGLPEGHQRHPRVRPRRSSSATSTS